ncbi:MAG: hypothetical protein AAFV88_08950 [Planctomycetota bacterium]
MHERTQRAVARLLFVFCCAVPTFAVLTAILVCWSPWYQARQLAELEYRLGLETGLVFEIRSCRQVAPGKFLLDEVELNDPETHQRVARCRMIDFFEGDEHIGIELHQTEIRSAGLGRLWSLIHDRVMSRSERTIKPVRIKAADVNLISATGSLPLGDVFAEVVPEPEGVRMIARAASDFDRTDTRLAMDLFRDRSGPTPSTEWVVSTEGTALPCSALAEYLPFAERLGPGATFRGVIRCNESEDGWAYDLASCTLQAIDLGFVSDVLPHRMSGRASVSLRRCLIRPGHSVNLLGRLTAEDAWIDASLLVQFRDQLGLLIDESVLGDARQGIDCKLAAVDFEVTDQSLRLTGVCDPYGTEIMDQVAIFSQGEPIAWTDPARVIRSDRITAVISPPSPSLPAWNQVFLPSLPNTRRGFDAAPSARIRRVNRDWSGGQPTMQR